MKRIFSWNINGIRAADRKGLQRWIKNAQPDILALQETKAHKEQLSQELKEIEGYTSYFKSAKKRGYSGVALYCREEPLAIEALGVDDFDVEGRTIIAKFPEYTLINCYFPDSQLEGKRIHYKLAFCDAILEKCNSLIKKGENLLLCGDYNIAHKPIDLKNPKDFEHFPGYFPEEREWMTRFLNSGYVDTFRHFYPDKAEQYTWWSYQFRSRARNNGWRIDYNCVNQDFLPMVKSTDIHNAVTGSDHCPVSINLDI